MKVYRTHAPFLLTQRADAILTIVHCYRYVTPTDLHLLLALRSRSYLRSILSALAGGRDYAEDHYLYRFPRLRTAKGSPERIYTLAAKGRRFLELEMGIPTTWY